MQTLKKLTFAATAFLMTALTIAACTQKKQNSDNIGQIAPKEEVKKWYKAFNTKNSELLESILDDQWQDLPADPNHPVGKKEVGGLLTHLTTVFPDFNCEIKDILQDGDKIIVRSVLSGKQHTDFMGFTSKGRSMSIQAVDIHEFRNGKIIRTWHTEDWLSGLSQLGHMPEIQSK